ncbi:hypothetical protein J3E64_003038 [Sphingobium sp. OAS761]|uniref:hypothetical protein n=1 Tax=Sphingobium sp. OAS761 TaxID=2817901 RepID=UPI00209F9895|nr:hypothetical protein [Sphingobium sp. OAS761]MCP1471331.1 hypothetical protein [Sphingobium sp. OAS761]
MRDQYDARMWVGHHHAVAAEIDRLLGRIMDAFRVLNDIRWAAPWSEDKACRG